MYAHSTEIPLDRRHILLAAILVLIGSVRIVSTYTVFSHTMDEVHHLAAGMEWLDRGEYTYEDQHPPLARAFAAVGPFLAGERSQRSVDSYQEGERLLGHDRHYDRILALGRAGILPFFWAGALAVFLWGHRAGGPAAAIIATFLFTTLPPVLAHAGLITTDMALTAMAALAAYVSLWWADAPNPRRTFVFGVVLGLAVLSKFTAVVYLPCAWLLMYAWHLIRTRTSPRRAAEEIWSRRRALATIFGIAWLVIWAGYRFSFARVEFLNCRLPAARFFLGIGAVWEHNQAGHASYLLGQRHTTGVWYFFPVTLAVKTPIAMLLLLLWTPWLCRRLRNGASIAMPLAFSLAILLFAMTSRINLGVRHILPVYIGFAIVCGVAGASVLQERPGRWMAKAALLALLAWHVASGALQHPDYLAYTNEITGDHPENFVADSDLDWGQDMLRLGDFLQKVHAAEVTFVPFNSTYPAAGHPFPRISPGDPGHPSPGWNVASISLWKIYDNPHWVSGMRPQIRLGRTTLLWYFPPNR